MDNIEENRRLFKFSITSAIGAQGIEIIKQKDKMIITVDECMVDKYDNRTNSIASIELSKKNVIELMRQIQNYFN